MRPNALLRSTEWTILFVTVVTITAEFVPALKQALGAGFSHHWIGKSVLSIIFFGLCLLAFEKMKTSNAPIKAYRTSAVAIIGSLILTLFFVAEYLGIF